MNNARRNKLSMLPKLAVYSLLSGTMLAGPSLAAEDAAGYIYTTLNGTSTNMVVAFDRQADGSLTNERAYSTDSKGGANPTMGGDAAGDFDSQGGIDIVGNYLLNANAGGNTISVFQLDRKTGNLTLKGNVPSGGVRPVSIAVQPKAAGSDDYWVVVANQMGNPNVQKGGTGEPPIEFYPNKAFFAPGGDVEKVASDRNLALMSFDASTGELKMERVLQTYNGVNGGPDAVEFSPDGTKIALATWGVAHFTTMMPTEQRPSRVYVYDFDPSTGEVAKQRHFEEQGIAGSIGFNWNADSTALFVSNFNLAADKLDNSVTVLKDDGKRVIKTANFGTGDEANGGVDEACWTALSPDGKKLYVASFGTNIISEFNVSPSGELSVVGAGPTTAFVRRPDTTPSGDTKDLYLTPDGKSLYVIGAFQSFTVSQFNVADGGDLTLTEETRVKAATATTKGSYNFLGLTGFSKSP
jgi:DNA-binding beta-propeller fold protein YncE